MSKVYKTSTLSTVTNEALSLLDVNPIKPFRLHCVVVATDTISFDVEYTVDGTNWINTSIAASTATDTVTIDHPVAGVRLVVNSVTGGTAQLTAILD